MKKKISGSVSSKPVKITDAKLSKKPGHYPAMYLERKIYTFWERNHIFGIRIPVAGGNELSVCLSELKVPEDSQQEAGY